MGRHKNPIKQCPQCGIKEEDGGTFYNLQRICVACSKKNSKDRAAKQRELFARSQFKTNEDFKKWNEQPEHKLKFDTSKLNYRIAMGFENNTSFENVRKDRVEVR